MNGETATRMEGGQAPNVPSPGDGPKLSHATRTLEEARIESATIVRLAVGRTAADPKNAPSPSVGTIAAGMTAPETAAGRSATASTTARLATASTTARLA